MVPRLVICLRTLADVLHDSGRELLLCAAWRQPAHLMERADFHRHVGDENICLNIGDALVRAETLHNEHLRRTAGDQHEATA